MVQILATVVLNDMSGSPLTELQFIGFEVALDWQWVVQSERHVIACQLVMYWQVEWLFIGYLMESLLDQLTIGKGLEIKWLWNGFEVAKDCL